MSQTVRAWTTLKKAEKQDPHSAQLRSLVCLWGRLGKQEDSECGCADAEAGPGGGLQGQDSHTGKLKLVPD